MTLSLELCGWMCRQMCRVGEPFQSERLRALLPSPAAQTVAWLGVIAAVAHLVDFHTADMAAGLEGAVNNDDVPVWPFGFRNGG